MAAAEEKRKFVLFNNKSPADPDRLAKLDKYSAKLDQIIKESEQRVLDMQLMSLENRILQESNLNPTVSRDVQNIWKNIKTDGVKYSMSKESAALSLGNVDISQAVSKQKITSVQSSSIISEEGYTVKSWTVFSLPSVTFPEVKLKTTFKTVLDQTESKTSMPSVHYVKFKLQGLEDTSDLGPAIDYCQTENDIELFSRLLEEYLEICTSREKLLEEFQETVLASTKGQNIFEFRNRDNKVLVYLCLETSFDESKIGWTENWTCKFTQLGMDSAASCNIPQQLVEEGSYEEWTLSYAIETLGKMATLDVLTPFKEGALVSSTPLNSQPTRAPKRRLPFPQ